VRFVWERGLEGRGVDMKATADARAKAKPKGKPKVIPHVVEKIVYLPQARGVLTRKQVARLLSVSLRSLASMIAKGEYPKADGHIGPQQPRWLVTTHDEWVRKRFAPEE
jgi:predicted DNA-binding transcriptional regulator AlpA